MNVALLRKVKAQILAEPRQVAMECWFGTNSQLRSNALKKIPNCGTTGCIGGWAISIQRKEKPALAKDFVERKFLDEERAAENTLKISQATGRRLFYVENWPNDFRHAYANTEPQTIERASVIARRIDAFIKSKGKI